MSDNRRIYIDKFYTINLEPEKKANDTDILNNEILQKNLVHIFNDTNYETRSGGFNTVFSFPHNNEYVLRMMHWRKEYYTDDKSYTAYVKDELKGLRVQSGIHDTCEEYTCKIYEYGTYDFEDSKSMFCKRDIKLKKGVYAILEKCGKNLKEYMEEPNWVGEKGELIQFNKLNILQRISQSKIIIGQVLEALNCLHNNYKPNNKGHLHGDIKEDNIMIKLALL